jgi:hypothetical protein
MAKVAQDDRGAVLIGHRIDLALAGHVGPDEAMAPGRPFIDDLPRREEMGRPAVRSAVSRRASEAGALHVRSRRAGSAGALRGYADKNGLSTLLQRADNLYRITMNDMKPRTECDIDAVALTPEAMEEAKQAAAAAGISVQAWLTRAIITSAQTAPVSSHVNHKIADPQPTLAVAAKVRAALGRLKSKEATQQDEGTPSEAPETTREPPR